MRINLLNKTLKLFLRSYSNAITDCYHNERMNISNLKEVQLKKLRSLINHAKTNVPYYKEILKDINITSLDDLGKIPFLSKSIIHLHFSELHAKSIKRHRFKKDSTSGSTGETTRFFTDKRLNYVRHACAVRGDSWTGWSLGEPSVYLWGASKDTSKAGSLLGKIKNSRLFFNSKVLSSYKMTDQDMAHYVSVINKIKPSLIVGYPSALALFTDFIKKNNFPVFSPKGIITGGETLYEEQREQIEEVFKTKVLNRYGCREVGHIANECEMQKGLHISSDHVVVEVVNEKGELCKTGELGELVITDLDNYVFPFIRYKIGDIGVLSARSCKCGRPFSMLESVEGRTFDLLIGVNGNRVLATFFTIYFRYNIKGIQKFQIEQEHLTKVKVNLVVNENFTIEEEKRIIYTIKTKLGEETNVQIERVDFIEPTSSGKYRWIISNVSPFNK